MLNSIKLMTFGPLVIRAVLGAVFIINGWPKLQNIQQMQGLFTMIGLPQEMAVLIALLEVIGGIALIIGVLTRITAALFTIEMVGAFIINMSNVLPLPKGYESALITIPILLLAISISLVLTGPGRISIEWNLLKRELIPFGKELVSNQYERTAA